MMRGRLLNMLFVRQQTAALFFFSLVIIIIFWFGDKSFPIIWELLGLYPAKHPSEWLAILIGLGGIASNRIENKIKVKIEFEISTAICESCLSFARARWILPGSIPEIVKLFS